MGASRLNAMRALPSCVRAFGRRKANPELNDPTNSSTVFLSSLSANMFFCSEGIRIPVQHILGNDIPHLVRAQAFGKRENQFAVGQVRLGPVEEQEDGHDIPRRPRIVGQP